MLAVREELALAVERERDSTASAHTTAGEEARAAVGLQTTADAPAALARFKKPPVGSRVRHADRGEGTVVEHMADGRTRVEFDSGESHRYFPALPRPPLRGAALADSCCSTCVLAAGTMRARCTSS